MKEKDFQIDFNKWLKSSYKESGVFELKRTKTNSLPFSSVVLHQEQALWHTKNRKLVYKIPDVGYQNPYDCVCLSGLPAFVVIRYPEFFCLIDIDDWLNEKNRTDRKSLLSSRAIEIACKVINRYPLTT